MKTAVSREQRIQGTIDITDRLVELASQQGIQLDAYAWTPDPSNEKRPAEYYYLTVSAAARHCKAKFSCAVNDQKPRQRQKTLDLDRHQLQIPASEIAETKETTATTRDVCACRPTVFFIPAVQPAFSRCCLCFLM